MARPLRMEFAGGLYYVTTRGDLREDIYVSPEDREAWLEIFGGVCIRFKWVCHAYCLLTNHYEIVIETPRANLSKGMRQLNGVYTQYVNRTHLRTGPLFQGRFKAVLVQKEAYLLPLACHTALAPVRARLVRKPERWAWSSYRATVGKAPPPDWLTTDWILGRFSSQRKSAIRKYEAFVQQGVSEEELMGQVRHQLFLGDEKFVARMRKKMRGPEGVTTRAKARRVPRKPLASYAKEGRKGMAKAYLSGGYTMQEIADHFHVHYATVSRIVKKYEEGGI